MRLMKSIYGMKQASRIWNQTFHNAVTQWGFERLECEWCVYRRQSASGITIFVLHVDDILSASSNPDDNSWFRDKLKAQWDISDLGPTKFALGIAITRDRPNRLLSLSQTAKIDRLVEQYNQNDAHPVNPDGRRNPASQAGQKLADATRDHGMGRAYAVPFIGRQSHVSFHRN